MYGFRQMMGKARRHAASPAWALGIMILASCVTPPATAPTREATPVSASFGKTWDAVIDIFAAQNIPIRNMERASGFIAAEPATVAVKDGEQWSDCGGAMGGHLGALEATYNVLVRGDSTHATVRATVLWARPGTAQTCTTKGVWEQNFEALVKARAEGTTTAH